MEDFNLILTLTGCLAAALVCGYITLRLGLSPIVGYLLAGVVVGPATPGFVADRHLAEQFAEVGVILLMFGVGLQFHVGELLAVRRVALPGAIGQSLAATVLGVLLGLVYGWGLSGGVVFGLAISVASTVVLMRVLEDNGDLHTPTGHLAVGWLVVEDLFTVLVLVLLPALFGGLGAGAGGAVLAIGLAILKIAVMVFLTFVLGERLIPRVLDRASETRSRELFVLTVLVLALGVAVGSAKLFGVSMALGAFLAGMVVGRSEFSLRAATEALPMRDAFAVLFFVSVGILFNPHSLLESPGLIAATLCIVLIGKPLAAMAIVLLFRRPLRVAISVAVALAQIGEFSFILSSAGRSLGLLNEDASSALVAAAIISITLNPLLYRLIGPLESILGRFIPERAPSDVPTRLGGGQGFGHAGGDEDGDEAGLGQGPRHRVIIIGYGPVGQTLARMLRTSNLEPVIIELNHQTVRRLNGEGVAAIYGDATRRETLVHAGMADAIGLFLSSASMYGSRETIRQARELNPDVLILARCIYLREIPELRGAGADMVFASEGEVALAMTEFLLRRLGADDEQIEGEVRRIRSDLFPESPVARVVTSFPGWPAVEDQARG